MTDDLLKRAYLLIKNGSPDYIHSSPLQQQYWKELATLWIEDYMKGLVDARTTKTEVQRADDSTKQSGPVR